MVSSGLERTRDDNLLAGIGAWAENEPKKMRRKDKSTSCLERHVGSTGTSAVQGTGITTSEIAKILKVHSEQKQETSRESIIDRYLVESVQNSVSVVLWAKERK
jgi:hypothetical protein